MGNTSRSNRVLYSTHEDAESFHCTSAEEAVLEAEDEWSIDVVYPVHVYAWRPIELEGHDAKRIADAVIEFVVDYLSDEEWTSPDDVHEIKPEFEDALRGAVLDHLPRERVWHCDRSPEDDVVIESKPRRGK